MSAQRMERVGDALTMTRNFLDTIGEFRVNPRDFPSPHERGGAAETAIVQREVAMDNIATVLNRSQYQEDESGRSLHVICPVAIPRRHRSFGWVFIAFILLAIGLVGSSLLNSISLVVPVGGLVLALFGPHYWFLLIAYIAFQLWQNSFVSIPDGCQGLVTRYGKLERMIGPGRTNLFDPWSKVSYVVNVTREYPYNAPVREAPTASRVNAAVDLFLLFKIEDPSAFIFRLGGATGFEEKLQNVISEVARELVFRTEAERIYDLVGATAQHILERLNTQFLPAVRFVEANITHAEPASQEYRINLAKPEMLRVAQEAYSHRRAFLLQKERDEGELAGELAVKTEQLSVIRAESATFQAQIDTALERETHRANAVAQQLLRETESAARARAALAEAQSIDIRAASAAASPEALRYRYRREVLRRLEQIAERLPQMVIVGDDADTQINILATARRMLGVAEERVFDEAALTAMRSKRAALAARIQERNKKLRALGQEEAPAGGQQ